MIIEEYFFGREILVASLMFPIAFLLRLGVAFIFPLLFFPRGFHFQRQVQWQNPKIQGINRHKTLMEQSRLLGCGLVGSVGHVRESTVHGAHLQPRLATIALRSYDLLTSNISSVCTSS